MSQLVLSAAESASGSSAVALLAIAVAVIYLLSVWINPYGPCRACKGTPKSYGRMFTTAFDLCRACEGRGRRVRVGARLFARNRDVK
ncbi:MAG TPA: hypothetical protein DEQ61_11095 [Streptomyces sp.]|nr:hypothetical protein [Streptomyces sp.]